MRKLAAGAAALSLGLMLSNYLYRPVLWWIFSGILLLCCAVCFLIRKKARRMLQIVFLMLSLGLTYFSLYHTVTVKTAEDIISDEAYTAVVFDYPEEYGDYSRVSIVLKNNGCRCKALLYDYYNNTAGLTPGDVISFSAGFRSMLDAGTSVSDSNMSKGILLSGKLSSGITLIRKGTPWLHISKYLSHEITELIPEVFPNDTVPFLRALMIGRKTDLYSDNAVYPVLLRSGFMHTVAISGMHISFIAGFCLVFFGSSKRGAVLSLVLIWLFVFMSGNTPSAARAGIMQTLLLLAPFFRRENDPLTSLSLALAVLLLINPFAAGSISLQLSFAAVLGITLFSSRINDALLSAVRNKKLSRIMRYPIGILSASAGVMAFTVPLGAIHFGYVSFLSFITNILALWAIPVCFCGAYICIVLYLIIPGAGIFLASCIAYVCRYIFSVCSLISGIPYAVIPYEGILTLLLFVLIYLLFFFFAFSCCTKLQKLMLPLSLSLLLVAAYFVYFRVSAAGTKATVTVLDVGQGECVAAHAGNRAVVIDCGTSDLFTDPGVDCADHLYARGQNNIDALVLTHLHSDHVSGVCHLMELIQVGSIFIPVNTDTSDEYFDMIRQSAQRTGTDIILVDADSVLSLGDISIELYPSYIYTGENESCMSIKLNAFERTFLITGDGTYINELLLLDKGTIGDVDVLVAGHHGANGSSCTYFLENISPEYSVISVGKDNPYGHPSYYVIERMRERGINVYRTDLSGRVSFIIN